MEYKYNAVICAGTFEHIHEGHKTFLRFAFSLAEKVYVTVTSDMYIAMYKPDAASFADRVEVLKVFLEEEDLLKRAIIIPINDVYGIAIQKDLDAQALVVTHATRAGADKVNQNRISLGLPPLAIEVTPLAIGPTGLPISSTQIRTGMFGKNGELTIRKELMQTDLHLPEILRHELQKPFGSLASKNTFQTLNERKTIAVGDVTTRVLHEHGIHQVLSLVDFVVQREKQEASLEKLGFDNTESVLSVTNPPATITPGLWDKLESAKNKIENEEKIVIVVNGEEDLAVLPILLEFPIGYTICYGQPNEGMVVVDITGDTKKLAIAILSQFTRNTTRGY